MSHTEQHVLPFFIFNSDPGLAIVTFDAVSFLLVFSSPSDDFVYFYDLNFDLSMLYTISATIFYIPLPVFADVYK